MTEDNTSFSSLKLGVPFGLMQTEPIPLPKIFHADLIL